MRNADYDATGAEVLRHSAFRIPHSAMAWRDLYPFTSRYFSLGPHRLHYVNEGSGQPLLFVHGNPTWSFYWRNLIIGLRDDWRCIAVDHLGCGLSDKPQDYNYTLAQRIDDLVLASFGMSGYQGFEPGKHGVFLVFPVGEHRGGPLAPNVWRMQCWYTPLAPQEGETSYGRWDFCGDGATPDNGVVENWFEMLDSWYDDPDPDTGGYNGYRW